MGVGGYSFDLRPLIWLGALAILVIWGCWELVDIFLIDHSIKSNHIIIPKKELIIKNNKVDTVYIYPRP